MFAGFSKLQRQLVTSQAPEMSLPMQTQETDLQGQPPHQLQQQKP